METVNAIQLRPQDRKEVERILGQLVPNEEVWAYGSRVDGSGHELSDLDLVIRHPGDLKQKQDGILGELKEAFSESNLPFLVDVHDWASLPEQFHEIIRKEYVILQKAASSNAIHENVRGMRL
jgi:predicted nucleotidyltransferase